MGVHEDRLWAADEAMTDLHRTFRPGLDGKPEVVWVGGEEGGVGEDQIVWTQARRPNAPKSADIRYTVFARRGSVQVNAPWS